MGIELDNLEITICHRCNNAFFIISVEGVKDYIPYGLTCVSPQRQGAIPIFCPACGGNITSYQKEINANLDKFNKWKDWAVAPTPRRG